MSQQWVGDSYYTGTLTMIDTATDSVIAEGGGEWHTDLEVRSDGHRIYAGVGDYRYVREFDAQTMAGVGTVVVTGPYWPVVTSVNLSPDDKRGYAVVAPDMYHCDAGDGDRHRPGERKLQQTDSEHNGSRGGAVCGG